MGETSTVDLNNAVMPGCSVAEAFYERIIEFHKTLKGQRI